MRTADDNLKALHNEWEFFSEVEQERNNAQAALALFNATNSVKSVLHQAAKNGDHEVVQNSARIIKRLREELHYRKEVVSNSLFKEGVQLFFGYEKMSDIYAHHFKQIEVQRKAWGFTLEDDESAAISKKVELANKAGQIKCLTDEELFITTIRSTPDILEATDLCRRALHDLKRVELEALSEGNVGLATECTDTIRRVKESLHALCQINQNSSINYSIRVLLDKEDRKILYAWLNSQPEYNLIDELQHKAFN